MLSSKKCFKCGIDKDRSEFYRHPAMGDGLIGKCKECAKTDVRAHRLANLDRIRRYDRERAKNPERAKAAAAVSVRWRQSDKRITAAQNEGEPCPKGE